MVLQLYMLLLIKDILIYLGFKGHTLLCSGPIPGFLLKRDPWWCLKDRITGLGIDVELAACKTSSLIPVL